jgi:hypothetical protein
MGYPPFAEGAMLRIDFLQPMYREFPGLSSMRRTTIRVSVLRVPHCWSNT